ncbi:MAG: HAD family phosphatase [Euryarchaeota archaeon]|nr:HAD family phosphatase [Euryarchaeota archaeon]
MRPLPVPLEAVVFDLDDTLLRGRTIRFLGREFGFADELERVFQARRADHMQADEATGQIARFLKGRTRHEVEAVVRTVPASNGAREAIAFLRSRGVRSFIATDGYDVTASAWASILGVDGWISLGLTIKDGRATGDFTNPAPPPCDAGCTAFSMCKGNALATLAARHGFTPDKTAFVGDGPQDVCGFRKAGFGVVVGERPGVRERGDAWLPQGDLTGLPAVLGMRDD